MATRSAARGASTNGQPPESKPRAPLLELRELAPQDFVRVFGETYDVVDLDSLSIRDRAVIAAHFDRILTIERLGVDASDEDDVEHDTRVATLLPLILPTLPAKVLESISRGKRAEICGAFLGWASKRSLVLDLVERLASVSNLPGSPPSTAPANGS